MIPRSTDKMAWLLRLWPSPHRAEWGKSLHGKVDRKVPFSGYEAKVRSNEFGFTIS